MAIAALIVAASDRDISVYGWFPFHFLTLEQDRAVVYACWLVVKRTDERECEIRVGDAAKKNPNNECDSFGT